MAIKGSMDVYNDFKNGNVNGGTALSAAGAAGGAVGTGALLALGASNPIGWIALAVGGAALLGRELYESANSYKEAGKAVEKEWTNFSYELSKEVRSKEKVLLQTNEFLKDEKTTESARQELINSGLLSEADMQKAQTASREELQKLTNQYIQSTKDFSNAANTIINDMKNKQRDAANETVKSIQDWVYGDASSNFNENNLQVLADLSDTLATQIRNKGDAATSDEKEYLKRYDKNRGKGKNTQGDYLWELKSWDDGKKAIATALQGQVLEEFTNYASYKGVSGIKTYDYVSPEETSYVAKIMSASSKSEAQQAIASAKAYGINYETYKDYIDPILQNYDLSYRQGLDYVPYDNYIANLHEGESVLTASTANELRNLVVEYRETNTRAVNFEAIIQSQTVDLITKLDEVISAIRNNVSPFSDTGFSTPSKLDNMLSFKSSKAFI